MQRQQTVSEALSANEVRKYSSLQLFQLLTALWGSSSYWGLFCNALVKGIFLGGILAVAVTKHCGLVLSLLSCLTFISASHSSVIYGQVVIEQRGMVLN